jgi:hypothetical protein
MDTVDWFLKKDNKTKLTIVALVFFIYLVFVQNGASIQTFVILLLVFILFSYKNTLTKQQQVSVKNVEQYILDLEKQVIQHRTPEMVLEHIYVIHKPLKDLYYIRKNVVIKNMIYKLKFLQIYEQQQYLDIVVMIEYFLKIHFNVMIEKYDHQTYYAILGDIRDEVLNSLYACYYNVPRYSKTYDSPNLEGELKQAIYIFQSITFKLLKVLRNKYQLPTQPQIYDTMKNNNYHIM